MEKKRTHSASFSSKNSSFKLSGTSNSFSSARDSSGKTTDSEISGLRNKFSNKKFKIGDQSQDSSQTSSIYCDQLAFQDFSQNLDCFSSQSTENQENLGIGHSTPKNKRRRASKRVSRYKIDEENPTDLQEIDLNLLPVNNPTEKVEEFLNKFEINDIEAFQTWNLNESNVTDLSIMSTEKLNADFVCTQRKKLDISIVFASSPSSGISKSKEETNFLEINSLKENSLKSNNSNVFASFYDDSDSEVDNFLKNFNFKSGKEFPAAQAFNSSSKIQEATKSSKEISAVSPSHDNCDESNDSLIFVNSLLEHPDSEPNNNSNFDNSNASFSSCNPSESSTTNLELNEFYMGNKEHCNPSIESGEQSDNSDYFNVDSSQSLTNIREAVIPCKDSNRANITCPRLDESDDTKIFNALLADSLLKFDASPERSLMQSNKEPKPLFDFDESSTSMPSNNPPESQHCHPVTQFHDQSDNSEFFNLGNSPLSTNIGEAQISCKDSNLGNIPSPRLDESDDTITFNALLPDLPLKFVASPERVLIQSNKQQTTTCDSNNPSESPIINRKLNVFDMCSESNPLLLDLIQLNEGQSLNFHFDESGISLPSNNSPESPVTNLEPNEFNISSRSMGILSTGSNENLNEAEKNIREGMNRITKDKSLIYTGPAIRNKTRPSKQVIMTKIYGLIQQVTVAAKNNEPRVFEVRNPHKWNNCDFENGSFKLKDHQTAQKTVIKYDSPRSRFRFVLIHHLLLKMYSLLKMKNNSICTQRAIYYQMKNSVKSQTQIRLAMNTISSILEVEPWYLPIVSTSKGLVYGDLTIVISSEEIIHCNSFGGTLIPQDITRIKEFRSKAYFILVVEKDAAFKKLLDEGVPTKFTRPFILVTGKGFPDINTRLFVKKLWMNLRIPIFALVDANVFGIDIMLTYRFGSRELSHVAEQLAIPKLKWLGVLPSDFNVFNITSQQLDEKERNKLKQMLNRPYVDNNPWLKKELNIMLEKNCKAEIEGVMKNNNYLTDFYLVYKFYNQNYF